MNLHVRNAVAIRHHTIEGSDPPLTQIIQDPKVFHKVAGVRMSFLMNQGMSMSKEAEAGASPQDVVDHQSRKLEAVVVVAPHGPKEQHGDAGQ